MADLDISADAGLNEVCDDPNGSVLLAPAWWEKQRAAENRARTTERTADNDGDDSDSEEAQTVPNNANSDGVDEADGGPTAKSDDASSGDSEPAQTVPRMADRRVQRLRTNVDAGVQTSAAAGGTMTSGLVNVVNDVAEFRPLTPTIDDVDEIGCEALEEL